MGYYLLICILFLLTFISQTCSFHTYPSFVPLDVNGKVLPRPNIVFMMGDQQRGDSIHYDGTHDSARTPNIDWMGKNGVLFHRAYSSTPSCTPARAAILTGLSPWRHGMIGFAGVKTQFKYEMPFAMKKGGYITHGIGKMHYGWNTSCDCPYMHGFETIDLYEGLPEIFDDYEKWLKIVRPDIKDELVAGLGWNDYRAKEFPIDEIFHPTTWTGRKAVEFIEKQDEKQPFFLKVSWHRPHSPYDPPKRLADSFNEKEITLPWLGKDWDERYNQGWKNVHEIPTDIIEGNIGIDLTMRTRRHYWAAVTHVDEQVGEVIYALKRKGLLDNTLLIYTADHGDMMGDHYHWRKCTPYEGSTRIPMVMKWPSTWANVPLPRGSILKNPVELRDLLPTFLDAARIPLPKGTDLDGQSFLLLLQERFSEWRQWLDLEHDDCYGPLNRWNAGTDGYWKYVWRATVGEELLWHLEQDPAEKFDLSKDPKYENELKKWRERIVEQFKREGRGSKYVKDEKLAIRKQGQTYSPHYHNQKPEDGYWRPKDQEEKENGFIPSDLLKKHQSIVEAKFTASTSNGRKTSYLIDISSTFIFEKAIYITAGMVITFVLIKGPSIFRAILQ